MPTKFTIILLSACMLTAAAACSSPDDQAADPGPISDPSDDSGGSRADAEPLDAESADQAGGDDPSAGSAVERVGAAFLEVDALVGRLTMGDSQKMAQCMNDAGFPQLLEHEADSPSGDRASLDDTNRLTLILPHEMGPYTESQAREFGLVGSIYISRIRLGILRSNDPAYNRQYTVCDEASRDDAGELSNKELDSLAQATDDMRYAIESRFRTRATPPIGELVSERIACLTESGYGSINPEDFDGGGTWTDFIRRFGIQPGETRILSQTGEEFDAADLDAPLPPGETRLILSADMPFKTYFPSAEEVDLALVYVRCGEEIGFVERLEELQIPIRAEILAEFETEILGLRERVLELIEDG